MKMKQTFAAIAIALSVFSCTDSELEDPERILPDETLFLEVGATQIRYAAQDTTTVTARIPREAGILDVKFTATHGTFVASNGNTISERTEIMDEDYRYAMVRFTSDSSSTTVYLTAEVSTLRKRLTLKFIK